MGKIDRITVNGSEYEIVPEIAPLFDASTNYKVGEYVIKDAILYRFNTAHTAGAWIGTDADKVVISSVVEGINSALIKESGISILNNWQTGYFPADSATTSVNMNNPTINTSYVCQVVECSEGDVFSYSGLDRSGARAGVFISTPSGENNILAKVAYSGVYSDKRVFAAPEGAHYLLSNARANNNYQLRKLVSKHQIYAGTDVNDLSIPGTYYCHTSAASQEIDNIPDFAIGKQFMLTVEPLRLTNEYYRQVLYITTSSADNYGIFIRNYTAQWGDWKKVSLI